MSLTLSGNVCIRNGLSLDYCFAEAIESLLPVCDEVVACDGESTDGTQEFLRAWCQREPKLKLCVYKWPDPKGDPEWQAKMINYCREHIHSDYHLQLDADELIPESSYPEIRRLIQMATWTPDLCAWAFRYNFWKDAQHYAPHGAVCSDRVVRLAPRKFWMPSDGTLDKDGLHKRAIDSKMEVLHYGFLRQRDAFFAKSKVTQGYYFNSYDTRLEKAELMPGNWMENCDLDWMDRLVPYAGNHPDRMIPWLKTRGFEAKVKTSP